VISAGEALERAVVDRVHEGGDVEVYNLLGATETCVDTTFYRCARDRDDVQVGVPLSNYRTYVLDTALTPAPVGVLGELWVGGEGLARGYRSMPKRTAVSFVPDPYGGAPGARMYRTRDTVRWTSEATLEYGGRVDNQVQVRGVRVELKEIETLLVSVDGVRSAAVVAVDEKAGRTESLTAFVVLDDDGPTPAELREFLLEHLDEVVVPTKFVELDQMPQTTSGKIDRKALPDPVARVHDPGHGPIEINGIRVDLAELEAELAQVEEFGEVALRAFTGPDGRSELVAYVVPTREEHSTAPPRE
jgi:enterobactin synthetase component F